MATEADTGKGGLLRRLEGLRWRHRYLLVLAALILGVHWYRTAVWVIRPGESGVAWRLGRIVQECPAGIHFTWPAPIGDMQVLDTGRIRTMPIGFKYTDLVNRLPPSPDEVQWLTGDTNIVEIQVILQYVISDPLAYVSSVSDMLVGGLEARRDFALRKFGENALSQLVGRMPVQEVLTRAKAQIGLPLGREIQRFVDELDLGIQVVNVIIDKAEPPPQQMTFFIEVSSALSYRETAQQKAYGKASELLPGARAQARAKIQDARMHESRVVSAAQAAAERFREMARESRASPEITRRRLTLEMVKEALGQPELTIYPPPLPGRPFRILHVKEGE